MVGRHLRFLIAALLVALVASGPAQASVWQPPITLEGAPFAHIGQIAVNDDGEVVTLLESGGSPRLDWLSADGTVQPSESRRGVLGAAGDGTMFLLRGDGEKVYLATKLPGLPFGPDVPVAEGTGGGPMDVNDAGDIAMVLGGGLGLLRRGTVAVEPIEVPANAAARYSDIELTDGGEILAARLSGADREIVIVPPGGAPRVERVGDGKGCDVQVEAGPDGRAVAAWNPAVTDYGCEGGQNYAALRPAGGSFGAASPVLGVPGQTEPHIAVAPDGRAVLAYDSSHPNGVFPNVIVLTAGPADTAFTTSSTVVGYSDALVSTPAGVYLGFGTGFIGPHSGRVSDAGTVEDIQDVVADCQMTSVSFAVSPSGRAAALGWQYGPQNYAFARQAAGDAAAWRCGRDTKPEPPPAPPAPEPAETAPIVKPLPETTVSATVRRPARRRVSVRLTRSDAGRLTASGTLRVKGRRAIKAKATGTTAVTLTFRVPARHWRTFARKGARLTLTATSPEGGRWTFRRTVKR